MRVAILIRKWSVRGGNERVAVELARYLAGAGHRVNVYCQKIDPSADEDASRDGIEIERLPGISFDPSLAMLSFAWSAKRAVARLRAGQRTDVAIGFNHSVDQDVYRLGGGTAAELMALTKDAPEARGGAVLDRVNLALERARFGDGRFKLLVSPSHRVKEELIRHYAIDPARIEVVWNGLDLARFTPDAPPGEREEIRRGWGVSLDQPVLLFAGQDLARKGFAIASEVAARIGVPLVYVGKARRPAGVGPHVIWDGERRDMERVYRAADALLAPSLYDPFGGVVLEALASGLPAVATDRIGATERMLGTPLEALLVADPKDVETLIERTRLALDPAHSTDLRVAARAATRSATQDAWGRTMEDLLERVASSMKRWATKPARSRT